ncbi:MAG: CotH kinase family protein [Bacteroidota bacterium]
MSSLPFPGAIIHRSAGMVRTILPLSCILITISASGQFFINEVMPSNAEVVTDYSTGNHPGWIELYNPDPAFRNLSGYFISDDPAQPQKYRLPPEAAIAGKGHMILWCDGLSRDIHTNFSLSKKGEWVILSDPFGAVIDKIAYPDQYIDFSYGRKGDGGADWGYFDKPTPEASNSTKVFKTVSGKPEFSILAGAYTVAQTLTIDSPTAGAIIRYTRDGNEPNQYSDRYTGPILISFTQTVKAKLFVPGALPGETVTNTYIIDGRNFTLPVLSISTSPGNLWDDNFGIHVVGTNGTGGNCTEKSNWNQEWYKHAVIEYFGKDGFRRYREDADIRIGGACSRTLPQKSFVVRARSKYGSNEFDFNFLPNRPFSRMGGFILRNSGNDFNVTHFRDALQQSTAADDMDIDHLDYRPVSVYLNGEYWGIMNIREKPDSDYITANYGYEPEEIHLIDQSGRALEGEVAPWYEYLNGLENMDRTTPEAWKFISDNIDAEEYISYLATEIYLANTDWPGNNQRWWRPRASGGKWRWVLYDLDFGMGLYEGFSNAQHPTLTFATNTAGESWPNPPWSTLHIRLCLENPTFRMKFIRRMNAVINETFHPDRLNQRIDEFMDRIAYEMPYHKTKWGGGINDWFIEIARLKKFAVDRNQFMRTHLREFFSLGDSVRVTAAVETPNAGRLVVNGVRSGEQFIGFMNRDLPLEVTAVPKAGYRFLEWEVTRGVTEAVSLVPAGTEWRYLDDGQGPASNWTDSTFDDSGWASGAAQLGYGDGDEKTTISFGGDESNKFITTWFRHHVSIEETTGLQNVLGKVLFDDGVVVYVNGAEVFRGNMPEGEVNAKTLASAIANEGVYTSFTIPTSYLKPGENLIAAEVHQVSGTSSDISFDLSISANRQAGSETITRTGLTLTDTTLSELSMLARFTADERDFSGLRINEVFSNPTGSSEPGGDWLELINTSSDTLDLDGVFVSDDRAKPLMHALMAGVGMKIPPGGLKVLRADSRPLRGPDHLPFRFSSDGDEAGLYVIRGEHVVKLDEITFGLLPPDGSLSRIPDGDGPFVVTGTATFGTSNVFATSIEKNGATRLFPNPSDGTVTIQVAGAADRIELMDLQGRVLMRDLVSDRPVDISGLAPGIYVVRVQELGGMTMLRLVKR